MNPSRSVLKSSLDLWDAVDKLCEVSRKMLPPQESAKMDSVLAKGAKDTLELLGAETEEDTSESSEEEFQEITEVRNLRSQLKRIAGT